MQKFDLEDRVVDYTCRMMDVVDALPNSRAGNYTASPLMRSCHSPAFNQGELQAAESRADFIHKLRICLKELKECCTALKIILKKELIKPVSKLQDILKETEELIAIIFKCVDTATKTRTLTKMRIAH